MSISAYQRALMPTPRIQSSAVNRIRQFNRTRHNDKSHRRGHLHENSIIGRLPEGMPLQIRPNAPNWYSGHRPGSRIRNTRQRFLQEQRQMSRRNPAQFSLRRAPVREYNATDPQNVSRASQGWTNANNFVTYPEIGQPNEGNTNYLSEATQLHLPYVNAQHQPQPRPESDLYFAWHPLMRRVRRPMTNAEIAKEYAFRQRRAEQAQRRGRELYRSPKNISHKSRKVKSLSLKKSKIKKQKHSA